MLLAKEITARFHGAPAADAAEQDFINRAKGGVPDDIPEVSLGGAPLGIGALLKQAGLVPSTSEAMRMVEQGGVQDRRRRRQRQGPQARAGQLRGAGRQAQVRARDGLLGDLGAIPSSDGLDALRRLGLS